MLFPDSGEYPVHFLCCVFHIANILAQHLFYLSELVIVHKVEFEVDERCGDVYNNVSDYRIMYS